MIGVTPPVRRLAGEGAPGTAGGGGVAGEGFAAFRGGAPALVAGRAAGMAFILRSFSRNPADLAVPAI